MFDPITFAAAVKAAGKPTDEQVAKYFTDHPEAVIPDGSVTANKLSSTAYATQAEVDSIIDIIEGGE